MKAHWSVEDPAAVKGDDQAKAAAFAKAFQALRSRIATFVDLPPESLGKLRLKEKLEGIGRVAPGHPDREETGDNR